ncbi:MAG: RidA family protein [Asgard group archaeon]|nr:RidA family protein [Asgard group archaeon]
MTKKIIHTKKAPAAIGPYSQGVLANNIVFISGQIPFDPDTNELIKGSIAKQTKQVLKNIQAVIEAAGGKLQDIVKCTVFLQNMDDFSEMNKIYETFFTNDPPARAAVEVARLPKDVGIEIEAFALLND